jgi:hypothetical protein
MHYVCVRARWGVGKPRQASAGIELIEQRRTRGRQHESLFVIAWSCVSVSVRGHAATRTRHEVIRTKKEEGGVTCVTVVACKSPGLGVGSYGGRVYGEWELRGERAM